MHTNSLCLLTRYSCTLARHRSSAMYSRAAPSGLRRSLGLPIASTGPKRQILSTMNCSSVKVSCDVIESKWSRLPRGRLSSPNDRSRMTWRSSIPATDRLDREHRLPAASQPDRLAIFAMGSIRSPQLPCVPPASVANAAGTSPAA